MLISFIGYSFGQTNDSENNFDKAKSSSDEVLSLIDSLKGSSLINSVVGGMENFTLTGINQSNNTDGGMGLSIGSNYNPTIGIDQNVTNNGVNNRTTLMLKTNTVPINNSLNNMQSLLVLPYPMSIQSKDYVPLYSSLPLVISNGTILTKLPCDVSTKPLLQIVGSSVDNIIFSI